MIELDKKAAQELRKHITGSDYPDEDPGLRVAVVGGGCSGFQYRLLLDLPEEDDSVFETAGEKVICDPNSLLYVDGSTITYQDGMQESGFRVDNPRAQGACGCGSSFYLREE